MRWVCPHCRTSLETRDGAEPVGPRPGWAYARCFQCDEYAVVELATARTEAIAHPRRKSSPPPFKHPSPASPESVPVAPAAPAIQTAPIAAAAPPAPTTAVFFTEHQMVLAPHEPAPAPAPIPELPEPLPIIEAEPSRSRSPFPAFLAFAGILAITGALASQWSTRPARPSSAAAAAATTASASATATVPVSTSSAVLEPPRRLSVEPRLSATLPEAPSREPVAPEIPSEARRQTEREPAPDSAELRDSVRSAASSPRRPRPEDIQLYLQARRNVRSMELHTGPGMEYPLMGLADLDERYPVLEIQNRWFRVQLEETPGMSAWVAYERVELFSHDKELKELKGRFE